ncbi:unnamed protein product [Symbiodinium sp. KB8]|nr:unnamed protein product [Symbiodinium sp. KB8]
MACAPAEKCRNAAMFHFFRILMRASFAVAVTDLPEFREPCKPRVVLKALQHLRGFDLTSATLCDDCDQTLPRNDSDVLVALHDICCGCFSGYTALLANLHAHMLSLKADLQTDYHKLLNVTETIWNHRVKLRRGPGYGKARRALHELFGGAQTRLWHTGHIALSIIDGSATAYSPSTVALDIYLHFKRAETEPAYDLLVQSQNLCLPNVFQSTCEQKHLPIFENFPAVAGPGQEGFMLDFLGVSMPIHVDCEHSSLHLFAPGRSMPCEYLKSGKTLPRTWPMLDEEYLEWADSLTVAFRAAKAARPFRMAELGSGAFGIWAMRAAKAFAKFAAPDFPCMLLLVEPFAMGDGSELQTHVAMNLPPGRCEFAVHTDLLETGAQLKTLLGNTETWDLVDIDIEGAEMTLLPDMFSWLSTRVRRLHISTHSREIHWTLLELMQRSWHVAAHYPTQTAIGLRDLGLGEFMTMDGHISAVTRSPLLAGPPGWS